QNGVNPQTGQPFSEALLLGIGGGLGAGYILWEFSWAESANIVLGFRNRWNYSVEFLKNLCGRLGAEVTIQETSGIKAAAANLSAALERGVPFIAWVDKAHLPHQGLPEALKGYGVHQVGVYGLANGSVEVDDLVERHFLVPVDIFAAGRAQIPSDKNRLALVAPPANLDLSAAVRAGIEDCIEHLSRDSESFSLPVYKKWAKLMTDTKNKKGWPVVFKTRKGLFRTLCSVYEGIRLDNTEGCGLRGLYADFLDEAAVILQKPTVKEAADLYREAANAWVAVADAALPENPFREARVLLDERYALYHVGNLAELAAVSARQERQVAELSQDFPLDAAQTQALYEALQAAITAVYDAEVRALDALKAASV
ncbi:MAG TPA: DUF4872 domain-containing protein, partial [Phototrophicaceae bacterium]|nr:DUF4872 domain-containing protein [Phototrophicaceae bacterium]